MKQSGISRLFILACIAVLMASYGVGLGVKKVRFAAAEAKASEAAKMEKPGEKPNSEGKEAVAKQPVTSQPSEQMVAEPSEQAEEPAVVQTERPQGRRTRGGGMSERFQNMTEEERREAMAQARERFGGRTRGQGGGRGGAFSQMSDEDREKLRAEMDALNAKADEMSEDEMRQARSEIMQKYGITPRGGGEDGGRRAEGTQE